MKLTLLPILLLITLFIGTSASQPSLSPLISETLMIHPMSEGNPIIIGLWQYSVQEGITIQWRRHADAPRNISYNTSLQAFTYETRTGVQAIRPSGELTSDFVSSPSDGTGRSLNSIKDLYNNIYDWVDNNTFRSRTTDGQIRYQLSFPNKTTSVECAVSPAGDAVCISPAFGAIGIRKQTNAPQLFVDGREQFLAPPPFIESGTTFVPVRGTFDALSAIVKWDQATREIHINAGKKSITLNIDSNEAEVNTKKVILSNATLLRDDHLFVPL